MKQQLFNSRTVRPVFGKAARTLTRPPEGSGLADGDRTPGVVSAGASHLLRSMPAPRRPICLVNNEIKKG